jgi:glutathione S-transferase
MTKRRLTIVLKLYGFPISNYTNMVKIALLEKGIEYEDVNEMPSQEESFKKNKSAMGKLPTLGTDEGILTESTAIFAYLDALKPEPALLPSDPFARAKVIEIARYCELYIELAGRRLYPQVFFGGPNDEAAVKPALENAITAISQIASFDPYMAGSEFTYADIVAVHSFPYCNMAAQKVYGLDVVAAIPGLGATLEKINARPTAAKVLAEQMAALEAFQAQNG